MSPKVLIIDDLPLNSELIGQALGVEGFRVSAVSTGNEALALSRDVKPDLILVDVPMAKESGSEICSQLKSDPLTAEIPVIFLSALHDVGSRVKGLQIGGVDCVWRPFHPDELLARVRVHLRTREMTRVAVSASQLRIAALPDAQQSVLIRPEQLPDARFDVCYLPLEETGGDFYDVVKIDKDVFGYFVADVSGHGAGAAFITSALKALLRQYSGPLYSPDDTMPGINSVFCHLLSDKQYLTARYARLNLRTQTLSVISAGHPPLIRVRLSGGVEIVETEGDAVGLFHTMVLHCRDIRIAPGEQSFLYTDGLLESAPGARRDGEVAKLTSETLYPREKALDDLLLLGVEVQP